MGKEEVCDLSRWFSVEEISCKRQRIMETILELAQQQNPSNVDRYNKEKQKGKFKLTDNTKYNEWIQGMAQAEFHCRRGYSREESIKEVEEDIKFETKEVPAKMSLRQDLKLAFIESAEQICDVKREISVKVKIETEDTTHMGNIWKNRLRIKSKK